MIDFATRAHNLNYRFNPIVRSLMDTDFYKLLMMQFIWEKYPMVSVMWKVTNRSKSIRLADDINIDELREQLDHVRTLRFSPSEIIWLRGQTFYGQRGIFKEGFLNTLHAFQLPEYKLGLERDTRLKADDQFSGQFELTFDGHWWENTLWEIYALTIINELRVRAMMRRMNKSQIDITYARAKVKLYAKLERLADNNIPNITDFGTRRRHGFLWQQHCVMTAKEVLGANFTGTSNVLIAMENDLEAKGTNAHELPMVLAALARQASAGLMPVNTFNAVREAQYKVLRQWQTMYHENLLVALPDTFGTTQFLSDAPQFFANWTGARPDSKDPYEGGEELIAYWRDRSGLTPEAARKKLIIFSDGMDVWLDGKGNGTDIVALYKHFEGRIAQGFGWGTNFTNDFIGCCPFDGNLLKSISLVCKVAEVNGTPAVKLSDNYEKATGPADEIALYREIFGTEGVKNAPVLV